MVAAGGPLGFEYVDDRAGEAYDGGGGGECAVQVVRYPLRSVACRDRKELF